MVESVAQIQTACAQINAEAVEKGCTVQSAVDMHFDGTVGNLQQKYPELYNKLVIQPIAYQIVHDCKRSSEHFIEEMKKHRNS